MPKCKTPAEYHALAQRRGFRWLGPSVSNTAAKTNWQCGTDNHVWAASFHNIQAGSGCPRCSHKARRRDDDYHALADQRGFRWLGPSVSRTSINTKWQCDQGHTWEATFTNIQKGRGCPYCANHVPYKDSDYHALARERNFLWLGPSVPTVHAPTQWQCKQGHVWKARFEHIKQGHGCPFCANRTPKTPDDYRRLAENRGFLWRGPEAPNNRTPTEWECGLGHRWMAIYANIQQGTGCPYCANYDIVNGQRVSQPQRTLCDMLDGILNHRVGNKYVVDVAIHRAGVAIAVEYDSWFWHADQSDYDARRDLDLIAAGWCVLRIKSRRLLPSLVQIDAAISALLAGATNAEIILSDWGDGFTFAGMK